MAEPVNSPAESPTDAVSVAERRRSRAVAAVLVLAALALFAVAGWRAGAGDRILVRRWVKRLADRDPGVRAETVDRLAAFAAAESGSSSGVATAAEPAARPVHSPRRARVLEAVAPMLHAADDRAFSAACALFDRLDPGPDSAASKPDIRLRRHMLDFFAADAGERAWLARGIAGHLAAAPQLVSAAFNAALCDPVFDVRSEAAWALMKWNSPAAAALRRSIRNDANKDLRKLFAVLCAASADADAGAVLAEFDVAEDPEVRAARLLALAQVNPAAGRRAAAAAIDDRDLRPAAVYLLGFSADPNARRTLESIAEDRANPAALRAAALAGLARPAAAETTERHRASARELLASRGTRDAPGDNEARTWAAWTIGRHGGPAAGAELFKRIDAVDRFSATGAETAMIRMLGELNYRPAAVKLERIAGAGFKIGAEEHAGRAQRASPIALSALAEIDPARAARVAAERIARVPPHRPGGRPTAEISDDPDDHAERAALWAAYVLGRSGRLKPETGLQPLLEKREELSDRAAALELLALFVAEAPGVVARVNGRFPAGSPAATIPEVAAVRLLAENAAELRGVRGRVRRGEWNFLLGWITARCSPRSRSGAWGVLLDADETTKESLDLIDRRLQFYGLDRELRADHPDMPRYEYFADRAVRRFQCYVLLPWWSGKTP